MLAICTFSFLMLCMTEIEQNPPLLVSKVIITDGSSEVLLFRRAPDSEHGGGLWEPAGGKAQPGETLVEARLREVKKETGLEIEVTEGGLTAEAYIIPDGRYKGRQYLAVFATAKAIGGEFERSGEHDKHSWVSPEVALDSYLLTNGTRKALQALIKLNS